MKNEFDKMLDLNMHYSKGLSKWAENTENLNDDALLKMLQNLMQEYEIESNLLIKKFKFDKEMYRKRRKFKEKNERVDLGHELKKTKFEIKKKKRFYKKLYKLFRRKLKLELAKKYSEKEEEFNKYCNELEQAAAEDMQKPERTITDVDPRMPSASSPNEQQSEDEK